MSTPHNPAAPDPLSSPAVPRRSLWRHWWKAAIAVVMVIAFILGAAAWYMSTPQFESRVRQALISVLERATGGRVELGALQWRLLHLAFEAHNLTIHGLEAVGEAPYAHADRIFVRVKILSLFRAKVGLNYLAVDKPAIHLIVYPDGSTNQPRPKIPSESKNSPTDTLLDLAVDRTEVNDGVALINQRAIPFNLAANNLNATVKYVAPITDAAHDRYEGTIHVEDLTAQRGKAKPVQSKLDLQMELGRNEAKLQSFRLQTGASQLEGNASLTDFADPQWKASLRGQVDIRIVEALAAIPGLDKGNAELEIAGQGTRGNFTVDGQGTVADGTYRVGTMNLVGVNAKTAIHITQDELALTDVQARFPRGGSLDGTMRIIHWLNIGEATPGELESRASAEARRKPSASTRAAQGPDVIAGNQQQGIVRARISGTTLASILSSVAPPAVHNLGFDTIVSGPVNLDWTGSAAAFVLDARLALRAPARPAPQLVPLDGIVDAQYLNARGIVNIRNLTAHTPGTQAHATGVLGVYPITRPSGLQVSLTTTDLGEFNRTLTVLGFREGGKTGVRAIPVALHGHAAFQGTITRSIAMPAVEGHFNATDFDVIYSSRAVDELGSGPDVKEIAGEHPEPVQRTIHWDSLDIRGKYAPEIISIQEASLLRGATAIHISGEMRAHQISPHRSVFDGESAIRIDATVRAAPLGDVLETAGEEMPVRGTLNLEAHAVGRPNGLSGGGHLAIPGGDIDGEPYRSLNTDLKFEGREIRATHLVFLQDGGRVEGDGGYNLSTGALHFSVLGTSFDLAHIHRLQNPKYPIGGLLTFEARGDGTVKDPNIEANLHLAHLNVADKAAGYMDAIARVQSHLLSVDLNARMTNAAFQVHGQTQLSGAFQTKARFTLTDLDVDPILQTLEVHGVSVHTSIVGTIDVTGPLKQPRKLTGEAAIDQFSLSLVGVPLRTEGPLHATLTAGRLHLDPFHVVGEDTNLRAQGSVGLFGGSRDLDLHANGSINMRLVQTLDSDLTASGHVDFNVEALGTFEQPNLTGQVKVTNVAMALQYFPNGLSQMNGTLAFNQDRLVVRELTGMSGGGQLQLGGFLTFQQGLYADLTAMAKDVRVRYPQGVSSMADAKLRLQGTQNSMLLTGNVTITRFAIRSDLDLAAFSSSNASVSLPPDPDAPANRLRLDIHVVSAPQLDFQNSFAKLAGEVDLRIRGTLAQPSVLGHISITEGSATFAGTEYELQHGDIFFTNPVRIDPLIDLSATTHVQDYDITIGMVGTTSKLTPTFRSTPPLSEQDIFSLLAVGRTQEDQQIFAQQQQQAGGNTAADVLLGGALNATVSTRIQKLFGVGSVKIDPSYVSGGISNSTARITVAQRIGQHATLTYSTNINSTAQQLIQAEVNLTQTFSVLAVRDESGVFSMLFKIRRRYK